MKQLIKALLCIPLLMWASDPGDNFTPTGQYGIYNNCTQTVWIQNNNQPAADPTLIKLNPGDSYSYAINGQSVPSFSATPKLNCDADGNNCETGQSLPPCPGYGCQPAVDSEFEASFNDTSTFYDVSLVNGYTLPFKVRVIKASNEDNTACLNSDGSLLDIKMCPSHENLSTPYGSMNNFGQFKFGPYLYALNGATNTVVSLTNVDMRVTNPNTNNIIGCYAPVEKLASPTWGGLGVGYNTNDPAYNAGYYTPAIMYSCPFRTSELLNNTANGLSPNGADSLGFHQLSAFCNAAAGFCSSSDPNGVAAHLVCNMGPIVNTQYVKYIHRATVNAYAFQYDDAQELVCNSHQTKIVWELCPVKRTQ